MTVLSAPRWSFARHRYLALGVLLVAAAAWVALLGPPGRSGSTVTSFVALWTLMMAAMMLPSVLPSVMLYATIAESRVPLGFGRVFTCNMRAGKRSSG